MNRAITKQLPKISKVTKLRAKELRQNMTQTERIIWARLRSKRINAKFLRQRPVGEYICDFISIETGIVIEIDGGQHYSDEQIAYDERRTRYLKSFGFEVLRFNNLEVFGNLDGVMMVIADKVEEKLKDAPPPLIPPPQARGDERVNHPPCEVKPVLMRVGR
jgi:very-short-patch-repair endonuclease